VAENINFGSSKEEERKMSDAMSKYGLEGVPSVVAEKNGKVFKFDAAFTSSSLKQFVEKVAAA
jgi:protein-disulfide isomerase-like protein with CxxC motif